MVSGLTRLLATLLFAGLLALAVWTSVRTRTIAAEEPNRASLSALAEQLSAEAKADDAIALLPTWSANERWRFEAILQRVGAPPDRFLQAEPLEAWDVDGARRLWVVSTHGQGDRYVQSTSALFPLEARWEFDRALTLSRFSVPASRTTFDFRRSLASAEVVRLTREGQETRCPWRNDKHECGGEWWKSVWQGLNEVGDTRRDCIFVQPWPDGGTLRLTYRDVPLGARIEGRFGLRLWALRYDEGSAVTLTVRVAPGGRGPAEEVARIELGRAETRWLPFAADLAGRGPRGDVVFEIGAEQSVWRQACFDARTSNAATDPITP